MTAEMTSGPVAPMSTIHFVGGARGGVGKSVAARLLAQGCIDCSSRSSLPELQEIGRV